MTISKEKLERFAAWFIPTVLIFGMLFASAIFDELREIEQGEQEQAEFIQPEIETKEDVLDWTTEPTQPATYEVNPDKPPPIEREVQIYPTEWFEGESINVTYSSPNAYPSDLFTLFSLTSDDPADNIDSIEQDFFGRWAPVGNFYWYATLGGETINGDVTQLIYCRLYADRPGTLYYNFEVNFEGLSHTHSGSIHLSADYIDRQGYTHVFIYAEYDFPVNTAIYSCIEVLHNNGSLITLDDDTTNSPGGAVYVYIYKNTFYYSPDTITATKRFQYRYLTEGTILSRLYVENWAYSLDITLVPPLYMNFSSISPKATVTETGLTLVITQTIPVTYQIDFLSGTGYGRDYARTAQYFAVDPYGYQDFEDLVGGNTTIVFEGGRSERRTSGGRNWTTSDLEYGEYLVSFSCYIESAPTSVKLQYYTSSWQDAASVNVSILGSWQNFVAEVHPTAADSSNMVRLAIDGSGIVFWDNIFFWQTNIQAYTSGYSTTTFSYTPRSVDPYLAPILDYWEFFNISLIDRTAQTTLISYNQTNYWDIDFQGALEAKEYELQVESCTTANVSKSYFTPVCAAYHSLAYTEENNEYDFCEGSTEGFIPKSGTAIEQVQSGYLTFNHTTIVNNYFWFTTSEELSIPKYYISECYIRLQLPSNMDSPSIRFYIYTSSGNAWKTNQKELKATTNWQISNVELADFSDVAGTPSGTIITQLGIAVYNYSAITDDTQLNVDYFFVFHIDSNLMRGYAWEFTEEGFEEEWVGYLSGSIEAVSGGYITVDASGGNYAGIRIVLEENIGIDELQFLYIRLYANGSYPMTTSFTLDSVWQFGTSYTSIEGWQTIQVTLSGTFDSFQIRKQNDATAHTFLVDYVRLCSDSPPNLYESESYFLVDAEDASTVFRTYSNQTFTGDYFSGEWIPKDWTVGSHSFEYCGFMRWEDLVYLPTAIYYYEYEVYEEGLMKILIHDQTGAWIPFDNFKVYIEGTRLYDEYVYFTDTSLTFNLTITDLFGYQLYTNASEVFEEFKQIELTLYSTKVQNIQPDPIWIKFQRGSAYWSEWVFSYEVVEYHLSEADYTVGVYYSTVEGNFSVAVNGTYVEYSYYIDSDTAIRVTGYTIEDVFGNTALLIDNLEDFNESIHVAITDQTTNITLQFIATNQNVTFLIGNSSLIIETLNSNFTAVFTDLLAISGNISLTIDLLQALDVALGGNITLLINQLNSNTTTILAQLAYLEGELNSNFTAIFADLFQISGNVTLTIDLLDALNVALDGNITLLINQLNSNATTILAQLAYLEGELNSNFTAVFADLFQISGNISLSIDLLQALDVNLWGNISLVISEIDAQTLNILNALITNTTFLSEQLNANFTALSTTIIANSSVLYAQTIAMLTEIANLQGIYRVHFTFVNQLGIGLEWERALCFVNETRQFDEDLWISNQTSINVSAYDYFSVGLYGSETFLIAQNTQINITIELWEVIFRNEENIPLYLEVERNGQIGIKRVIEANTSLTVWMLSGEYDYRVYAYENESATQDPLEDDYGGTKKLVTLSNFKIEKYMPQVISLTKKLEAAPSIPISIDYTALHTLLMAAIGGIIGSLAWKLIDNLLVTPGVGRHIKSPYYQQYGDRKEDWIDKAQQGDKTFWRED